MGRKPVLALVGLAAALLVAGLPSTTGAQQTPGLSEARAAAQQATQDYADAQAQLGELGQELEELEGEKADAEATLAALRDEVNAIAVERYINSGESAPAVFDEDLNAQVRASALARLATQQDADAIDEFRAASAQLGRATDEIEAKLAEQEGLVVALDEKQEALEAQLARLEELERQRIAEERRRAEEAAREAAAAAERQRTAAATAAATAAREQAEASAAALAAQEEARADGQQAAETGSAPTPPAAPIVPPPPSGGMVCPVPGSSFIDSYGAPRPQGWAHQGVDMMAPSGTPIVAPVSGTVVHRGNSVGGLAFHMDGSDGRHYYGAHLSAYGASGSVSAGTVIGYVGNTGDAAATAPHLHLEIQVGGANVNPYPYVAAVC